MTGKNIYKRDGDYWVSLPDGTIEKLGWTEQTELEVRGGKGEIITLALPPTPKPHSPQHF